MAMVPIVSAENIAEAPVSGDMIEKNYITPDDALSSSTRVLQQFIESETLGENWNHATINPSPLTIYDVNGKRLFYLFTVEKKGEKIGEIQAAASKILGGSVVTIGTTSYSTFLDQTSLKLDSLITKKYENFKITDQKFISYNYPKLGVLVSLINSETQDRIDLVYDAGDHHEVSDSEMHSFYSGIPAAEQTQRVSRYELENKASAKATVETHGDVSGFTLVPQINDYWCALATAQMISNRYSVIYTQTAIANTVNIGPTEGIDYLDMLTRYYQRSQSYGGLGKSGSTTVTGGPTTLFNTVKTEINAQRPVAISTMTHTRAIGGWQQYTGDVNVKHLRMFDPWPANYGFVYYEDFDQSRNTYIGSILVRN